MRIVIQADGRKIAANTAGQPLTSGSRGVEAQFDLSADYAGLAVTAAFVAGDAKVDVALTATSRCVVPWEVLETAGNMLLIGVVGKDGAGNIVIPTLWCKVGLIECGTVVSGIDPQDPTPDIAAQLLQIAQEVSAEAQDAKDSAVAAQQAIENMSVEAHDDPLGPSVEKRVDPDTGAVTLDFGIQRPPVQSVNNKTGAVTLNLDEIPDGVQYARATAAQVYQIGTNAKDISGIKAKIPPQASAQNPLTDKAYVDNAIQTSSAHYRGNWPTWADVPTDAAAYPADDSGSTTPASNDYMVVQDAAGYPVTGEEPPLSGTWRFKYTGDWAIRGRAGWQPEYQVSDSPLTAAQLAALNSGATAENIASIAEKYVKPVDGIPLVDLSENVAESLGKANTAYQLPVNGIPKTDLAAGVQQSLEKADTALQEHQSLAAYRTAAAQDTIDAAQDERITTNADDIDAIEAKIPPQASATNQLADKDFVNSSINSSTAFFRGSFATHAALFAVPWQTTNPAAANYVTNNDYAYVADDETHSDEAWRYIYVLQPGGTGNGWQPQFKVNDSPLTAAQLAALNSGATAENIAAIAEKYVKPATGIPLVDLSQEVAESLSKADTAYQLQAAGIPKADLAAGVQQSLDKADTALQEHQSLAAYRTAAAQDVIDAAQDVKIAVAAQATEETTVGPAAIASFDASTADMPLKSLLVNIEPVQDLHGYDAPWPAGGGKNLADINMFDNLQWNNDTRLSNGVTFRRIKNSAGQYIGISASGTATGTAQINVSIPTTNMINGDILSGSIPNSRIYFENSSSPYTRYALSDNGGEAVIDFKGENPSSAQIILRFFEGANANGTFLPMIRHATETDATFEPYSNICPIAGWTGCTVTRTGKNLFSSEIEQGVIYNSGRLDGSPTRVRTKDFIPIRSGGQYTISLVESGVIIVNCLIYDADKNLLRAYSISASSFICSQAVTDGGAFAKFSFSKSNTSSNISPSELGNVQLEVGPTATSFEPYQGNTYNITFPSEAGTVYGGTLDAVSGELKVTHIKETISRVNSQGSTAVDGKYRWALRADNTKPDSKIMCDQLPSASNSMTYNAIDGISVHPTNDNIYIYIDAISSTTIQGANAYFAEHPLQVVYELKTPITYRLTPQEITTLLGTNNIWADTGDVTVTYGAYLETIKAHADRLGDSILSAIAPLETTYTASRAYTVGSYLFVGTKFFKVTQAIGSGDTITPGTNVTQTTVAAQLMELAGI